MDLQSSLAVLKGLGPKSAEKFHRLGIYTIEDLLLYYPFRYEDFKAKSVLDLLDGEKAVVTGKVVTPANVQYYGFKRNRLSFKIKQDEAVIAVSFLISLIYKIRWSLIRILLFLENGIKRSQLLRA